MKNLKKSLDKPSRFCYHNGVGALAQLGAHNTGSVGVTSSSLVCSTKNSDCISNRNFYFLPLHYPLFTQNTPGNSEGKGNSEGEISENIIGLNPFGTDADGVFYKSGYLGDFSRPFSTIRTLFQKSSRAKNF